MSELDQEWVASEYFDDGRWGVITNPGNSIVLGVSIGLSSEVAKAIAAYHNERHRQKPVEYPSSPHVSDMPDEKTLPRHVMWAELKRRRLADDPEYFGSEVKPRTGEGS